jgi:outer membrane protein assembly factor BamB
MRHCLVAVKLFLLTVILARQPLQAQSHSWNQFRGPHGSGVATDCQIPVVVDTARATWATDLPPGHSSPVLSQQCVFLTAIDGDRLVTLALNKQTGDLLWREPAPPCQLEPVHEAGSPASSTPYVDDCHVYVYFGSYGVLCYDHAGSLVWQRPLATPKSLYGTASSPIVHNKLLILVLDDDANLPDSKLSRSKIIALDKRTGKVVWEAPRPFHRSGWSTPTVWSPPGGPELVVLGSGRLCGYDVTTGEQKWYVNGFSRETIARPIVGDGCIYGSASMIGGVADEQPDPEPFWAAVMRFDGNGDERLERREMTGPFTFPLRPDLPTDHPGFGMPLPKDHERRQRRLDGMFRWIDKDKDGFWTKEEFLSNLSFDRGKPLLLAVEPGGQGDITDSHVRWTLHRNIPEIPTPIFYRNRIYQIRDGGILSVVDPGDGRVVYRRRLKSTGHYRSSPVIGNDHLYLISELGGLTVLKTGDEFEVIHQSDLQQRVAATPAIDATTLFLRTEKRLYAFRARSFRG